VLHSALNLGVLTVFSRISPLSNSVFVRANAAEKQVTVTEVETIRNQLTRQNGFF
jgi:hypothetical protein